MNKKDLIDQLAYETGLTKKEIDTVLTLILEIIMDKVSIGERVRLVGFGSFYKVSKTLNLQFVKGEFRSETFIAKFSPGKFFKQRINIRK